MAVIYLTHPIHGQKVATMEEEAANDEKNGWSRYEVGGHIEAVQEQPQKRRGRPPKVVSDDNGAAAD